MPGSLWSTDGTAAGTEEILSADSFIRIFETQASVGDKLFFTAFDAQFGPQLWTSDGTIGETQYLTDLSSGVTESSNPRSLTVVDNQLFFWAYDGENGVEPWATDGTTAGTRLVHDTDPGQMLFDNGVSVPLIEGPGGLLYYDDNGLWRSDGTDAGTYQLFGANSADYLTFFDNRLFFTTERGSYGQELWVSDGTVAGTELFLDILPGSTGSEPSTLTVGEDLLFFKTVDGLWRTDGTVAGTIQVLVGDIVDLFAVDDRLFFSVEDATLGEELWVSDGTTAGTLFVKDIRPGAASSSPRGLAALNGNFIFTANDGTVGNEIWISDGTAAGTQLLFDVVPGAGDSSAYAVATLGSELYFTVENEFWKTNGTALGTQKIADVGSREKAATAVKDGQTLMYFVGIGVDGNEGLWQSDGTTAGTFLVDQFDVLNQFIGDTNSVATLNNVIYYRGHDPALGNELFQYDPNGPNDPPAVEISALETVVRGLEQNIMLTASNVLPDEAAEFTWHIDWDLDGLADESFFGAAEVTVQHTFVDGDSPTFQAWAVDQDSGVSDMVQAVVDVVPFALLPDTVDPSLTNLVYGGTPGFDAVFFLPAGLESVTLFRQFENTAVVNQFEIIHGVTGRVIAHAGGGNAGDAFVAEFMSLDVEFHGGNGNDIFVGGFGNDTLIGGGGHDILLGGIHVVDGDDLLSGGDGRDLLFGHFGADSLDGGSGEDLLLADRFGFLNTPTAIYSIQAEWLSGRSYESRVANLSGTGSGLRLNGFTFLTPGVTVADDMSTDTLAGGSELDWLLYDFFDDQGTDLETDLETDEIESDLANF